MQGCSGFFGESIAVLQATKGTRKQHLEKITKHLGKITKEIVPSICRIDLCKSDFNGKNLSQNCIQKLYMLMQLCTSAPPIAHNEATTSLHAARRSRRTTSPSSTLSIPLHERIYKPHSDLSYLLLNATWSLMPASHQALHRKNSPKKLWLYPAIK